MTTLDISVILVATPGGPDLRAPLAAIERSCAGLHAEVLVIRPVGEAPIQPSTVVEIRELPSTAELLVPECWGIGVRAAHAPVFACLTTEFTVEPGWARALIDALSTGAAAASGAIGLDPNASTTTAATYLTRFSAFLPGANEGFCAVENVPGDSAAYRRSRVIEHADLLERGFWEVEFHRRFCADGYQLLASEALLAVFGSNRALRATLMLRIHHGIEHGRTRVLLEHHNIWRILLLAPLVPAVLVARIWQRTARRPAARKLFFRSLPALLAINIGWAAGELRGAWSGRFGR